MTPEPIHSERSSGNQVPDGARPQVRDPLQKPGVSDAVLAKWQRIVDLVSKILEVRAALIVKLDWPQIEILAASAAGQNPYKAGSRIQFDSASYCEKVMALCRPLLVPNALADPQWYGSPQLALG